MTPPLSKGEPRREDADDARRYLGWMAAGVSLTLVNAFAFVWLGNRRVPPAIAMLIIFDLLAGGVISAIGAWRFQFRITPTTRRTLPASTRVLARTGAVVGIGVLLLGMLVVAFATAAIK